MMKSKLIGLIITLFLLTGCTTTIEQDNSNNLTTYKDSLEPKEIVFTESLHRGYSDYDRTFDTLIYESELFTISFEDNLLEPEKMEAIVSQLEVDLYLVKQSIDSYQPVVLYVTEDSQSQMPLFAESNLYLGVTLFESNDYMYPIIKKALGLRTTWSSVGVYNILFNQPYNQADILERLNNHSDKTIVSLYDTRFNTSFNTPEEISLAEDLSTLLAYDIYDKFGLTGLIRETNILDKMDWINNLGLRSYVNEDYMYVEESFYYTSTQNFPFIALSDRLSFYVGPGNYNDTVYIDTALELEDFYLLSTLNNNETFNYLNTMPVDFREYVDFESQHSLVLGDVTDSPVASIGTPYVIMDYNSELSYQMFMLSDTFSGFQSISNDNKAWASFALYNYIARVAGDYSYENYALFLDLEDQLDPITPETSDQIDFSTYFTNRLLYYTTMDYKELYLAYLEYSAYSTLVNPLNDPEDFMNGASIDELFDMSHASYVPEGFELTLNQSMAFSIFLIELNDPSSLEDYVFSNKSFKECFGMTYENAKDLWIQIITPSK